MLVRNDIKMKQNAAVPYLYDNCFKVARIIHSNRLLYLEAKTCFNNIRACNPVLKVDCWATLKRRSICSLTFSSSTVIMKTKKIHLITSWQKTFQIVALLSELHHNLKIHPRYPFNKLAYRASQTTGPENGLMLDHRACTVGRHPGNRTQTTIWLV